MYFLHHHKQNIYYETNTSLKKKIEYCAIFPCKYYGVTQGTILCPLLFYLYQIDEQINIINYMNF